MYSDIDSLVSLIVGYVLILAVVGMGIAIITIIARWKLFTKTNEEGWKSIIPVYSSYTMYKIVGVWPYWALIQVAGTLFLSRIAFLALIFNILTIYIRILYCSSLANSFNKGTGFAVGIFFLEPIFLMILAFGNNEYIGKKPMNDIIVNLFNKDNNNNAQAPSTTPNQPTFAQPQAQPQPQQFNQQPNTVPQQNSFCTNCGAQIVDNSAFCTNCGSKRN